MTVRASDLAAIRRPRILIRAARAGLAGYHRDRDLRRLLRTGRLAPGAALARLIAEERELEHRRRGGEATYALARHVAILTALIAEARNHPPRKPARKPHTQGTCVPRTHPVIARG